MNNDLKSKLMRKKSISKMLEEHRRILAETDGDKKEDSDFSRFLAEITDESIFEQLEKEYSCSLFISGSTPDYLLQNKAFVNHSIKKELASIKHVPDKYITDEHIKTFEQVIAVMLSTP